MTFAAYNAALQVWLLDTPPDLLEASGLQGEDEMEPDDLRLFRHFSAHVRASSNEGYHAVENRRTTADVKSLSRYAPWPH